jgi:hypothetical protein
MGKKWQRFKHLDENEYWREICTMDEAKLLAEYRTIQVNIYGASAGAGATGVAALFTFGATLPMVAVNARRINVNTRQSKLIEKRMQQMGWTVPDFRKRDWLLGVGPCVAAEILIPGGGALVGQASTALATHAGGHLATVASQHVVQAAQATTSHAVAGIAHQAPGATLDAVATHVSGFGTAAVHAADTEVWAATHGLVGHATLFTPACDVATAQAQLLGAEVGKQAVVCAAQEVGKQGISQATKITIGAVVDANDKRAYC